jgi:hypothetical protein
VGLARRGAGAAHTARWVSMEAPKMGWQWVSNMGYIFSWTLFSFIFLFLSKAN